MNIPRTIRVLRAAKGMTQEQLGKASNITKQSVSFLETGRTEPRMNTLTRMVGAFDLSLDEFFVFCRKLDELLDSLP